MLQPHYYLSADLASTIYLKEDPILDDAPHFHDSIEFIFIKKGHVLCHVENKTMLLGEGDIVFAESYETHFYEMQEPDVLAIVLVLSREYTNIFRQLYPGLTFESFLTDKEANKSIFDLMNKWVSRSDKTQIFNHAQTNCLFSLLIEKYKTIPRHKYEGDILEKELLRYIHLHYLEDITLKTMAHDLGYSPEYCSKILKKCLNNGIRTYINSLRLKKANELLADKSTNRTQLEILYQCGFSSPSTYYRVKKEIENNASHDKE